LLRNYVWHIVGMIWQSRYTSRLSPCVTSSRLLFR